MLPLSLSHKTISIFYSIFLLFSSILAISISLTISIELSSPSLQFIPHSTYHLLITTHGIIFLFFVVIALLIGTLPNYFIPIITNNNDVSFPSINNISF
jgi:heme/copper-type cytochrome/quinol oxidase subunit 1